MQQLRDTDKGQIGVVQADVHLKQTVMQEL